MPVSRSHVTRHAHTVTGLVDEAIDRVMYDSGRELAAGTFDHDPAAARRYVTELARRERERIRAHLSSAAQAAINRVWQASVDAFTADTGTPEGRAGTVEAPTRRAAALATEIDQVFWQASKRLADTVADAAGQTGATGQTSTVLRDRAWNRFLDRGPTVTGANGHQFGLAGHVQSRTESHLTQIAADAYARAAEGTGVSCVAVSVSARSCPLCDRWEGRLLALNAAALTAANRSTDRHVNTVAHTLGEAVMGGLFHLGCRHEVTAWIDNVSTLPGPEAAAADASEPVDRERERELVALLAKWERKAEHAATSLDRTRALERAVHWRTALAELRAANNGPGGHADPNRHDGPEANGAEPAGDDRDASPVTVPPAEALAAGDRPDAPETIWRIRQAVSEAADQYTDDKAANAHNVTVAFGDVTVREQFTKVTFRVFDDADQALGTVDITVTGGPAHGRAQLTGVDPDSPLDGPGDLEQVGHGLTRAWNHAKPDAAPERIDTDPAGVLLEGTARDRSALQAAEDVAEDAAAAFTDAYGNGREVIFDRLDVDGTVTYAEFDIADTSDGWDEPDTFGGFRIMVDGTHSAAARLATDHQWFDSDDRRTEVETVAERFAAAWRAAIPPARLGNDTYPVLAPSLFGYSNERDVRNAVFALFHQQRFDGFTAEVTHVGLWGNLARIRGTLRAEGDTIGEFDRYVKRSDQELSAYHALLEINPNQQGQRIADQFNDFLYDWYRASTIRKVRVYANITVGGYAWARHGFYWDTEQEANRMWRALTGQARSWTAMAIRARSTATAPGQAPDFAAERVAFAQALEEQVTAAYAILERADTAAFGTRAYPSPYDLSETGRPPGGGQDRNWIGKAVLLANHWYGVKWIDANEPSTSS